jgi:uncharacterized protein
MTYAAGTADPMAEPVSPELLDLVVAYFRCLQVILFGSVARGDAGPDSDIDVIVLLDDDTPPEQLTLAAGYQSRRSYHRAAEAITAIPTTHAAMFIAPALSR